MISPPSHFPKVLAAGKIDDTPALSYDFNVASISNVGTGKYRITFDTAMISANYVVVVTPNVGILTSSFLTFRVATRLAGYFEIWCYDSSDVLTTIAASNNEIYFAAIKDPSW